MTAETGGRPRGTRPETPRWVKALALGAVAVAFVIIVVMLVAGGEHGPGRHAGSVDSLRAAIQARHA